MPLTLTELQEKLKQIDEISLMEVLEITSEDLVDKFKHRINEKYEELAREFAEDSYVEGEAYVNEDSWGDADYD